MDKLLKSYSSQALFFLVCWMFALVFSMRFLISVSMIALIVLAVFRWDKTHRFPLRFRSTIQDFLEKVKQHKVFLIVTIPFFLVLLSGLYSSDPDYTLERLRIKLPFLLLPFAFLSMPTLSKKSYYSLYYLFLLLLTIACIYTGVNYLLHYDQIIDGMRMGQAIPTIGNHIRFSLMLALAILGGALLWHHQFFWKNKRERWLILAMTLFLFAFIHVLSVRSGLLVLYLSIAFLAARYIWLQKRWFAGTLVLASLFILPWGAYQLIPSFKAKIDYSRHDLSMYWKGEGAKYSDAERLISLQVGWEIAKENLLFGVGAGDLRKEVKERFAAQHPDLLPYKMPHNQFMTILAGTGILGLACFVFAFFYPLFYQKNYRKGLFFAFHIILFFSFLVENTIENAVGLAFYLLFLLIGLKYHDDFKGTK